MSFGNKQRELMFSLIEQWKVSGIKQKQFCLEQDIPLSKFYYWLRKYHLQDGGVPVSSDRFVELTTDPVYYGPGSCMEVYTPLCYRLVLPLHTPVGFIKSLIAK